MTCGLVYCVCLGSLSGKKWTRTFSEFNLVSPIVSNAMPRQSLGIFDFSFDFYDMISSWS